MKGRVEKRFSSQWTTRGMQKKTCLSMSTNAGNKGVDLKEVREGKPRSRA